MKRPAFQFYPADWRNNANLRRCSWAARGVWIEVMGLMHDSDTYGILRWTLKEIAQALGCQVAIVKELAAKEVLKGCDSGQCEALTYIPRHGRKDGAPVELISAQVGPLWHSSRMVKDEYIRSVRGESSRFGDGIGDTPNPPIGAYIGEAPTQRQGDGSTSSSSSSVNHHSVEPAAATNTVEPGKASGAPPSRAAEFSIQLRKWEKARGKLSKATSALPLFAEWAAKGVTDQQLRECYEIAVAEREAAGDGGAVSPGFVDVFLGKMLNPPDAKTSIAAAVVVRSSVCACGTPGTKQIGRTWYCATHDQYDQPAQVVA